MIVWVFVLDVIEFDWIVQWELRRRRLVAAAAATAAPAARRRRERRLPTFSASMERLVRRKHPAESFQIKG